MAHPQTPSDRIITLIRDCYPKFYKAFFLLKESTPASRGYIIALLEQKNFLQQISLALGKRVSVADRHTQIDKAEGHLRKALQATFERAFQEQSEKIVNLQKQFRITVIPLQERYSALATVPNEDEINSRRAAASEAFRTAYNNLDEKKPWPAWEPDIEALHSSFAEIEGLIKELHECCAEGERFRDTNELLSGQQDLTHKTQRYERLHWVGIVLGIIGIIVAIIALIEAFRR